MISHMQGSVEIVCYNSADLDIVLYFIDNYKDDYNKTPNIGEIKIYLWDRES